MTAAMTDRRALVVLADLASSDDTRVTAETQLPLFPKNGIPMGYLDLVLTFQSPLAHLWWPGWK